MSLIEEAEESEGQQSDHGVGGFSSGGVHAPSEFGGDFTIVTPGIRPGADLLNSNDGQNRVMHVGQAITAGADYLVVGRPISQAADPIAVIAAMQAEIAATLG